MAATKRKPARAPRRSGNTVALTVWIPPAIAARVREAAQDQHRTISATVELALEEMFPAGVVPAWTPPEEDT